MARAWACTLTASLMDSISRLLASVRHEQPRCSSGVASQAQSTAPACCRTQVPATWQSSVGNRNQACSSSARFQRYPYRVDHYLNSPPASPGGTRCCNAAPPPLLATVASRSPSQASRRIPRIDMTHVGDSSCSSRFRRPDPDGLAQQRTRPCHEQEGIPVVCQLVCFPPWFASRRCRRSLSTFEIAKCFYPALC